MKRAAITFTFALLAGVTLGASAQTVYRCGSVYSDSPCPQAQLIDASDTRTAAQRAAARQVVADEKQLGAQMAQERLAMESTQKPARATSLSGVPPKPAEHSHGKKIKWPKLKKAKPAHAPA